jgi:hypothetical protein
MNGGILEWMKDIINERTNELINKQMIEWKNEWIPTLVFRPQAP